MVSDAVILSVANYPHSRGRLHDLPGATHDSRRVAGWLRAGSQGVTIEGFDWPPAPPADPDPSESWDRFRIEGTMQRLLRNGLSKTRKRLFLYASAHGMCVPASPALPAIYCASHDASIPDLFLSGGWVPQLTAAPIFDEYLCFFDCCNDSQPGSLPSFQMQNLRVRSSPPGVLVMAACKPSQQALDTPSGGVFTDVLLEALSGSAGTPGSATVTAADVVAYVKENVPIRAAQFKPGHVQEPVVWTDANSHADLGAFVLFNREPLNGVDVQFLLGERRAAEVVLHSHDLQPVAPLRDGPQGEAWLPDIFPGKYVLRSQAWNQQVRVKTQVAVDGSVVAVVEARGLVR